MLRNTRLCCRLLVLAVLVSSAGITVAKDAGDVLERASSAMDAASLTTLKYSAAGTGYTFGQSYTPGTAWPKITVHAQARTINYDTGSMREEITFSRAEPKGSGGYPPVSQQKNDQFVSLHSGAGRGSRLRRESERR